ncbi:hypothetical protein Acor_58010 [Acrocarpospora corrugata]|uniref:Uncharacterized protein n=2 Tax=Acrocarpospora corrugata TaxID=35763 RepID=A0A5M3W3X2_9ACTN|nr:hypothetical protein Acor_58010 [Acrocarpospora corrugata]
MFRLFPLYRTWCLGNLYLMGVVTAVQVKKILKWGAVALVAFYLLSRPHDAADTVTGAVTGVMNAADSVAQFFARLS